MGFHAVSWVLKHSEARGLQRLVLIVLANYANDESGECWPAIATVAREAKSTPVQTKRIIGALEQAGYITRVLNAAPDNRIPEGRKPNLYRFVYGGSLRVPPWLDGGPQDAREGVPSATNREGVEGTPNIQENNKEQAERFGPKGPPSPEAQADIAAARVKLRKSRAS